MPPQGTPSLSCQRKRKRTGRAPAGHAVAPRPCDPAVRAARRVPIGSAATAVARRRGGDCAASEWSGRARARRIRHVRRLRRHWSRAPALWQLAAAWLPTVSSTSSRLQGGAMCTRIRTGEGGAAPEPGTARTVMLSWRDLRRAAERRVRPSASRPLPQGAHRPATPRRRGRATQQ